MKKVFFILALVVLLGGTANIASAQFLASPPGLGPVLTPLTEASVLLLKTITPGQQPSTQNGQGVGEEAGTDSFNPLRQAEGFKSAAILGFIAVTLEVIVQGVNAVLFFIGILLNVVVRETVVEMGKYITSESAGGIRVAWQIMRDVANIAIIGGIIASAVGTILNLATINAKKWMVRLILAALLVNFSYFFAGAVIDSSNFLATAIYKSTISNQSCTARGQCTIADKFFSLTNTANIVDIYGESKKEYLENPIEFVSTLGTRAEASMGKIVIYNLLFIILQLVSIFVFLSAIAMLIGRFVALIFILISSPLGIAGMAVPGLSKYAKQWWEALFSQAFFAPIYFLLLGFSFAIISNSKDALLNATGGLEVVFGIVLTFTVAAVFMMQSHKIAKSLSEQTKALAGAYKASGAIAGWMPGAYQGALAWGGTSTVGKFVGDKGLVEYNEKILPALKKIPVVGKFIPGSALDRGIKSGFEAVRNAKFGGKKSFADIKSATRDRQIEAYSIQDAEAKRLKGLAATKEFEKQQKKVEDLIQMDPKNNLYDKEKNPLGRKKGEKNKDYRARLEKEGEGLRDAREKMQDTRIDIPHGTWQRDYDIDPNRLVENALAMTPGEFSEAIKSDKVSKEIRNKMKEKRFGALKTMREKYEKEMLSIEKGGRGVKLYSERWFEMKNDLHEELKFKYDGADTLTMMEWDKGSMKSQLFLDALPQGKFDAQQGSDKFGGATSREARRLKRGRYLDPTLDYNDAKIISSAGKDALTNISDDFLDRSLARAEKTIKNDKALPEDIARAKIVRNKVEAELEFRVEREILESKDSKFTDADRKQAGENMNRARARIGGVQPPTEAQLQWAAEAKAVAQKQMKQFYEGKSNAEVNALMKQEHMEEELVARFMTAGQLEAVRGKDTHYVQRVRDNALAYGTDDVVQAVLTNPDIQKVGFPEGDALRKINAIRKSEGKSMFKRDARTGEVQYVQPNTDKNDAYNDTSLYGKSSTGSSFSNTSSTGGLSGGGSGGDDTATAQVAQIASAVVEPPAKRTEIKEVRQENIASILDSDGDFESQSGSLYELMDHVSDDRVGEMIASTPRYFQQPKMLAALNLHQIRLVIKSGGMTPRMRRNMLTQLGQLKAQSNLRSNEVINWIDSPEFVESLSNLS